MTMTLPCKAQATASRWRVAKVRPDFCSVQAMAASTLTSRIDALAFTRLSNREAAFFSARL